MGCAGWVGSQIRQHGACDGESQDDPGDSSRHRREQPVQFFAADVPHRDTDSDWQKGGVHTSVLAVNEHSL